LGDAASEDGVIKDCVVDQKVRAISSEENGPHGADERNGHDDEDEDVASRKARGKPGDGAREESRQHVEDVAEARATEKRQGKKGDHDEEGRKLLVGIGDGKRPRLSNETSAKARRGSGASRSKRVHFTEGGKQLHSQVAKATNVFDLMALLSVRMIPLQLGDYRETWKDPMPFYDYDGKFRIDLMEELMCKMDPNTAAMIVVRLNHLNQAEERKREEEKRFLAKKRIAPDGRIFLKKSDRQQAMRSYEGASKVGAGLFTKYQQLPHLLQQAIERLTNVADRLKVVTPLRFEGRS
jgi:hypothetical protein